MNYILSANPAKKSIKTTPRKKLKNYSSNSNNASIAQSVERKFRKLEVEGANPP